MCCSTAGLGSRICPVAMSAAVKCFTTTVPRPISDDSSADAPVRLSRGAGTSSAAGPWCRCQWPACRRQVAAHAAIHLRCGKECRTAAAAMHKRWSVLAQALRQLGGHLTAALTWMGRCSCGGMARLVDDRPALCCSLGPAAEAWVASRLCAVRISRALARCACRWAVNLELWFCRRAPADERFSQP